MAKIKIELIKNEEINKNISNIKKITGLGFSDIKKRIENNIEIIECELFKNDEDTDKIKELLKLALDKGLKVRVKMQKLAEENYNEVDIQYLINRINSYEDEFVKIWEKGMHD